MIGLIKGPVPQILIDRAEEWTTEYLQAKANGQLTNAIRFRYRHPEIKAGILTEAFSKCVYCESKITHVHPGETDHILPIAACPDLIVAWPNLTLVCTECNRRKSDYFDPTEPLMNPYNDDPIDHLIFSGPIILPKDDKGRRTWHLLELTRRLPLVERKIEKLEKMSLLLEKYRALPDGNTKIFVGSELLSEAANDSEFSATARSFLNAQLGWTFDATGSLI